MMNKMHIGCSGYYYPYWRNRFYPAGLQPKNWLEYYSSVFNSVELNGTFYRMPKLSDLQKYYSKTPGHFLFSVKMSRYVTHVLRLKDTRQHIADFMGLMQEGLNEKLANVLFQLPPSFQYSEENLATLITNIPNMQSNILEFRHPSWWNDDVKTALTNANLTFCNVDFPGLNSYIIQTSGLFYFRFHGNPELFKSSYSSKELLQFSMKLDAEKNAFVYFNNTYYEAGYTNALELMNLVE